MKILVTGAAGFLGRHVVAECLRRGHQAIALVRPATDIARLPWHDRPGVCWIRADLRQRVDLGGADCQAVVHTAAAVGGDLYVQLASTVVATEHLLEAMDAASIRRLIAISSFSVYEYHSKPAHSLLDEDSPIERNIFERDDYCIAKVKQERLVRMWGQQPGRELTIVRPGLLYGEDHLWTAYLGARLGNALWLDIGPNTPLPLSYVENCADAIVACVEQSSAVGDTFNVVDDPCPTHKEYIREMTARISPQPTVVPVPWQVARFVAAFAWQVNTIFFHGDAKLPSILVPARFHARCKPLQYTNHRLRSSLGWAPRYSLKQALERSARGGTDTP